MPQSKGRITYIGDLQVVTDTFKKRDFAIEVVQYHPESGEEFRHEEAFQVINASAERALDGLSVGQKVDVGFNVRSNKTEKEGQIRYFTNLTAYKVQLIEDSSSQRGNQTAQQPAPRQDDDLPF